MRFPPFRGDMLYKESHATAAYNLIRIANLDTRNT